MNTVPALIFVIIGLVIPRASSQIRAEARWCVMNEYEMQKCQALQQAILTRSAANSTYPPNYVGKKYSELPELNCVQGTDQYDCMIKIYNKDAHLMQLETGLSYTAGEYYNMMPLVAEQYVTSNGDEGLSYYAVAVVLRTNSAINIDNLQGARACMTGVGRAAGWIYPVSTLLDRGSMDVVECNVPVKSAANFFGEMCAPDGLARFYNPFGNNPVTVCKTCKGKHGEFCTVNDPYADYMGATNCLLNGDGDVAFVRNSSLEHTIKNSNTTLTADDFELICLDGRRLAVTEYEQCNWGKIASHVVMSSAVLDSGMRSDYKMLLQLLSMDFGANGFSNNLFKLFESVSYGKQNLMFTDETQQLKDVASVAGGTRTNYYTWAGEDMRKRQVILNKCPIQQARWCVLSNYEMAKCENMIMAFAARNLKPDLNCIKGSSVIDCMQKIRLGDADLITLDAADVYTAGKRYGLVPIAAEDYSGADGDEQQGYYAVAVARRADSFLTLFNLKQRRSCHSAVMSAAGWVIPVDKLIETGQIHFKDCNAYLAVGQYFSKSCVPGILDDYYNPYGTNPVSLCEACSTAGPRRCMRNDDELYFGASGAFRCLTEKGGDVAFVRHTTVRENTDGRNVAEWSRNRRSDDYELLCNDGTRKNIDEWADCNLGLLPPNAVMTAGFKSEKEREIYWTLLHFAEQFFDADTNTDFPMFDSMINHKDLIFQDATVRLIPVDSAKQKYKEFLGENFVRAMQRMESIDCVTGSGKERFHHMPKVGMIGCMIITIFLKITI